MSGGWTRGLVVGMWVVALSLWLMCSTVSELVMGHRDRTNLSKEVKWRWEVWTVNSVCACG